jgi:mannosyltransferase OCH1-like enzyme
MNVLLPLGSQEFNNQEKIPRVIHYCWFGPNPIPKFVKKCIKSWKKFLPDYKIILWNEQNFDVNQHVYTREAFEKKKYAFITDYVRIYVLFTYGGIYFDSDVEILKNLDVFLVHSAFSSFEHPESIPTGLMAAEKGNAWIKAILDYYEGKKFINNNGSLEIVSNTKIITDISVRNFGLIKNNKYQILPGDTHIYPKEYFCPWDWDKNKPIPTSNTYAIHHFSGSWVSKSLKLKVYLKKKKTLLGMSVNHILGDKLYNLIANSSFRKIKIFKN